MLAHAHLVILFGFDFKESFALYSHSVKRQIKCTGVKLCLSVHFCLYCFYASNLGKEL
nr:hypothetical protein Itr_chr12CG09250 [Ipomoea trifida]